MMPGANHCEGCCMREGQVETMAVWEARGVPGAGMTECGSNCMCELLPSDKAKNARDMNSHKVGGDEYNKFSTYNNKNTIVVNGQAIDKTTGKILNAFDSSNDNIRLAITDAVNDATLFQADFNNKEISAKIRELPLESKDIKLLKEKFKDIDFVETGYLPNELQKGFRDEFFKLDGDLGINFTYQLGRVSVQELPPGNVNDLATYEYDKKDKKGIIKINKRKYGLDINVTPEYLNKFKSTLRHESGHHLYQIHSLEKRVEDFYYRNNKYIFTNCPNECWESIGDPKEFFAVSFDRFRNGTLNEKSVDNKVYYFIKEIFGELRRKNEK